MLHEWKTDSCLWLFPKDNTALTCLPPSKPWTLAIIDYVDCLLIVIGQ